MGARLSAARWGQVSHAGDLGERPGLGAERAWAGSRRTAQARGPRRRRGCRRAPARASGDAYRPRAWDGQARVAPVVPSIRRGSRAGRYRRSRATHRAAAVTVPDFGGSREDAPAGGPGPGRAAPQGSTGGPRPVDELTNAAAGELPGDRSGEGSRHVAGTAGTHLPSIDARSFVASPVAREPAMRATVSR